MKPLNQMYDGRFRYEICVDEDTHWILVSLGASSRMQHEDYAEQILIEYAQIALRHAEKELEESEDGN